MCWFGVDMVAKGYPSGCLAIMTWRKESWFSSISSSMVKLMDGWMLLRYSRNLWSYSFDSTISSTSRSVRSFKVESRKYRTGIYTIKVHSKWEWFFQRQERSTASYRIYHQKHWFCIPYIGPTSHIIERILRRPNIKVYHSSQMKMHQLLFLQRQSKQRVKTWRISHFPWMWRSVHWWNRTKHDYKTKRTSGLLQKKSSREILIQ